MTIEEFNNTRFGAGMKCIYMGQENYISQVDFEECLLAIYPTNNFGDPEEHWVRCENIKLINS